MLIDVVDKMRAIIEPTPEDGLVIDTTCAEPLLIEARRVYAFDVQQALRSIETGPPSQETFAVLVVYVHALSDEEPLQERQRAVTLALSERRDAWVTRLLEQEANEVWQALTSVRAEYDYIRTLGVRGIAVRAEGYRVLG